MSVAFSYQQRRHTVVRRGTSVAVSFGFAELCCFEDGSLPDDPAMHDLAIKAQKEIDEHDPVLVIFETEEDTHAHE